jgi:hypothetical protein
MKTLTRPSDAPFQTRRTRLRQLCAVAVVLPALGLAACSGESAVTADPTAPASTTSAATSTTSTTAPTTDTAMPSVTTSTPPQQPRSITAVNKTFGDRALGHVVTVGTLSRNVPWPKGNPASEAAFEIIGVYVKATAGSRYSASINPSMFVLTTANPSTIPSTSQFGSTLGKPLPTVQRGQTGSGWLFFKVDRGSKSPMSIYLVRPTYKVSTTGQTLPGTRYGVQVTK